jgi:hypothetical protein
MRVSGKATGKRFSPGRRADLDATRSQAVSVANMSKTRIAITTNLLTAAAGAAAGWKAVTRWAHPPLSSQFDF